MMSATAGLHRDHAGWQLFDEFNQSLSPHCWTDNHSAAVVYTDNGSAVLPDVHSQDRNLHGSAPFPSEDIILDVLRRAGQPIINSRAHHKEAVASEHRCRSLSVALQLDA